MGKSRGCCCRQRFCSTCLLGLFSCHWTHKKGLKTSKCDCTWFFLLFCVGLLALAWLYVALITLNDFHNLNEFVFQKTEWWLDWSVVMLSVTATLVIYSSLLLILALCLQLCHQPLKLHWLHKGLLILTALIVVAAFVGLEIQWSEEWESAHIALQATGPFLHIGAVAGLTMLAWPVAACFYHISHAALGVLLLLLYLGATLALYLAPLGIDSPCFLEQSQLPPKPALFGHRGAPMLAPENTLMSFQKAVNCGLSVLETDVRVSADGIPFLMHDETLLRTTNVQEVFPTQAHAKATTFSWTQLQQLDAGSWFLQKHPFSTAWSLSEEEMAQARRQHVLSLKELLAEAKRHQVSVIFDLMPLEDPHYERLVNITVETVLQSGISQELILWLPNQFRKQVKQQAPRFQHIYGLESLVNKTVRFPRVNLAYQKLSSAEISEYRRSNISVNLYVINAPWLFSLLWCAGTSSVTTNACQVLQKMQRPTWLLPRATYRMIWIVTDCVSFLLVLSAFLLLKRWSWKKDSKGSNSDVLLTKIHSLLSE
ncbi:glycerophosphoinositol inositolphosphodiesterase GDPD2 [Crotalus tigris]|uniref:glycerophosphoinositol inositolphosphodiesterase GDPD2 n=1 Tax=Crotalus tigris TaxID=88082 RepID=UPI00192F3B9A|nr:glycerophosphoinositol inositolphosphodiesterase GDPD2 [Crotalus tigris]XP_039210758.1 glycerophosphoinositol inositolphosphodiesterase GDPD2 [Crotalus tigris]